MYNFERSSLEQSNFSIPEYKVGDSSRRGAYGWDSSSSRGVLVKHDDSVQESRSMGLHCYETWELQGGDSRNREGCEVCHEEKCICDSQNRCKVLAEKPHHEERCNLRTSSKVDARRWEDNRGLKRDSSRYGVSELTKVKEVQVVVGINQPEESFFGSRGVDISRYFELGLGFSDIGPLDEQQPHWKAQTFETATALAVGEYEPWEDYFANEANEVLQDIHGSDGRESV